MHITQLSRNTHYAKEIDLENETCHVSKPNPTDKSIYQTPLFISNYKVFIPLNYQIQLSLSPEGKLHSLSKIYFAENQREAPKGDCSSFTALILSSFSFEFTMFDEVVSKVKPRRWTSTVAEPIPGLVCRI